MKTAKQTKKPAIPQPQRIKYALEDVEDAFEHLKRYRGQPLSPEAEEAYRGFEKALVRLVRLDNTQLYHPYVQHYLLTWPNNKGFLRRLHRGLETGVRKQLKVTDGVVGEGEQKNENSLRLLNALSAGRIFYRVLKGLDRPQSFKQIQRYLEGQGVIKPMSLQAFHKLASRVLTSRGGKGPFYNPSALPQRPKDLPAHVKAAWEQAAKNLQELHATPERQKGLEEYIGWRRSIQRQNFPPKKPQP